MNPKVFKLGIRNDLGLGYPTSDMVLGPERSKVKVTGSQSTNKHTEGDRVAGVSLQSINQSININVPVSIIKNPESVARLRYATLDNVK